ncbi:hypothetical protein HDU76_008781 [Blyttiomyces sp. JEL0837]|nr:hypothetical protein HDU76_008781 [Blyttiomyces sp. JEL0837]
MNNSRHSATVNVAGALAVLALFSQSNQHLVLAQRTTSTAKTSAPASTSNAASSTSSAGSSSSQASSLSASSSSNSITSTLSSSITSSASSTIQSSRSSTAPVTTTLPSITPTDTNTGSPSSSGGLSGGTLYAVIGGGAAAGLILIVGIIWCISNTKRKSKPKGPSIASLSAATLPTSLNNDQELQYRKQPVPKPSVSSFQNQYSIPSSGNNSPRPPYDNGGRATVTPGPGSRMNYNGSPVPVVASSGSHHSPSPPQMGAYQQPQQAYQQQASLPPVQQSHAVKSYEVEAGLTYTVETLERPDHEVQQQQQVAPPMPNMADVYGGYYAQQQQQQQQQQAAAAAYYAQGYQYDPQAAYYAQQQPQPSPYAGAYQPYQPQYPPLQQQPLPLQQQNSPVPSATSPLGSPYFPRKPSTNFDIPHQSPMLQPHQSPMMQPQPQQQPYYDPQTQQYYTATPQSAVGSYSDAGYDPRYVAAAYGAPYGSVSDAGMYQQQPQQMAQQQQQQLVPQNSSPGVMSPVRDLGIVDLAQTAQAEVVEQAPPAVPEKSEVHDDEEEHVESDALLSRQETELSRDGTVFSSSQQQQQPSSATSAGIQQQDDDLAPTTATSTEGTTVMIDSPGVAPSPGVTGGDKLERYQTTVVNATVGRDEYGKRYLSENGQGGEEGDKEALLVGGGGKGGKGGDDGQLMGDDEVVGAPMTMMRQ